MGSGHADIVAGVSHKDVDQQPALDGLIRRHSDGIHHVTRRLGVATDGPYVGL